MSEPEPKQEEKEMLKLKIEREYDPANFEDLQIGKNLEVIEFVGNQAVIEVEEKRLYFLLAIYVANETKKPLKLHLTPPDGYRVRYQDEPDKKSRTISWVTSFVKAPDRRASLIYVEAIPTDQK